MHDRFDLLNCYKESSSIHPFIQSRGIQCRLNQPILRPMSLWILKCVLKPIGLIMVERLDPMSIQFKIAVPQLDRFGCCSVPQQALRQPIFSSPNVIMVLLDCSGTGMRYCCLNDRDTTKTSVVSISATTAMQSTYDFGLPPPAMNLVQMTKKEIHDVVTCKEESRPLLYTFAGAFGRGNLRDKLRPLHNGRDVLIVDNTRDLKLPYDQFLLKSKFAATPKGDDLFSYRFTEVMSAGAIPVIHADDWALPFSSKLIDWTKCAVIIPEAQVNDTISILSNISRRERCEMRKCVLHTYHRFMKTPERTIDGIIQSLDLLMTNTTGTQTKRKLLRG